MDESNRSTDHADGRVPAVSIGLPVRNGAAHLEAMLESIPEQTFGDFELIISDNASDDGIGVILPSRLAQAELDIQPT